MRVIISLFSVTLLLNVRVYAECPCIPYADGHLDGYYNSDGNLAYEGYVYPPNYGVGCSAHDENREPYCNNTDPLENPEFCADKWCYIDTDNCDLLLFYLSSYFPESGLYYSYETCGNNGTFYEWFKDVNHELEDLATVIETYASSIRANLEEDYVGLNVADNSSESCSYEKSCNCAPCTRNSDWGDSNVSFVTTIVKPKADDPTAISNVNSCISEVARSYFLKVVGSEYQDQTQIGYMYAGFQDDGTFAQWPAMQWCSSTYDPRFRPWYAAAITNPKVLILVIDVSGSMVGTRITLAVEAAKAVLTTLAWKDQVGFVLFNSVVSKTRALTYVTDDVRSTLNTWIDDNVVAGGGTSFKEPLVEALDMIDEDPACSNVILFLTDGVAEFNGTDFSDIQSRAELNDVAIFSYALGSGADSYVLHRISCENNGIFYTVPDDADLAGIMSSYYTYYAASIRNMGVRWVNYYAAATGTEQLSACVALYDNTNPTSEVSVIFGAMCIDINIVAAVDTLREQDGWDELFAYVEDISETCITPWEGYTCSEIKSALEFVRNSEADLGAKNCSAYINITANDCDEDDGGVGADDISDDGMGDGGGDSISLQVIIGICFAGVFLIMACIGVYFVYDHAKSVMSKESHKKKVFPQANRNDNQDDHGHDDGEANGAHTDRHHLEEGFAVPNSRKIGLTEMQTSKSVSSSSFSLSGVVPISEENEMNHHPDEGTRGEEPLVPIDSLTRTLETVNTEDTFYTNESRNAPTIGISPANESSAISAIDSSTRSGNSRGSVPNSSTMGCSRSRVRSASAPPPMSSTIVAREQEEQGEDRLDIHHPKLALYRMASLSQIKKPKKVVSFGPVEMLDDRPLVQNRVQLVVNIEDDNGNASIDQTGPPSPQNQSSKTTKRKKKKKKSSKVGRAVDVGNLTDQSQSNDTGVDGSVDSGGGGGGGLGSGDSSNGSNEWIPSPNNNGKAGELLSKSFDTSGLTQRKQLAPIPFVKQHSFTEVPQSPTGMIKERTSLIAPKVHACKSEYALNFTEGKFLTTFASIRENLVPSSHAVLFHYVSSLDAFTCRHSGLPVKEVYGGVALSLRHPYAVTDADFEIFGVNGGGGDTSPKQPGVFPNEEVLVLVLPRFYLLPLPGYEKDQGLCMVSLKVLSALRPSSYGTLLDPKPWELGLVLLPPQSIIRSFRIMEHKEGLMKEARSNRKQSLMLAQDASFHHELTITHVFKITDFTEPMKLIHEKAEESGLVSLFHYTTTEAASLIFQSGLRMSSQGQGDGGVYLSTQGPASYGLGFEDYEENIIRDCFGVERMDEYKGKGKFDIVLVYGCEPCALEQTPGGRKNAKMFSKTAFKYLSLEDGTDNYFLRKDRILAAFHIDSKRELLFTASALTDLMKEKTKETSNIGIISKAARQQALSAARIVAFTLSMWQIADDLLEAQNSDNEEDSKQIGGAPCPIQASLQHVLSVSNSSIEKADKE